MSKDYDFFKPPLSSDIMKSQIEDPNPIHKKTPENQIIAKNKKSKKRNKNQKAKLQEEQKQILHSIKIPETKEEIDAWIAERKRKFPTRQRIEAKEQEQQEREDRGALDLSKNATKEVLKKEKAKKKFNGPQPIEMSTSKPKKIPSILDKITEDEQRRKRSIVLQCFRYFVRHNFLQEPFDLNNEENPNNSESYEYYCSEEENNE